MSVVLNIKIRIVVALIAQLFTFGVVDRMADPLPRDRATRRRYLSPIRLRTDKIASSKNSAWP